MVGKAPAPPATGRHPLGSDALWKGALKSRPVQALRLPAPAADHLTKGQQVREIPIPHPALWTDLERHLIDVEAQPNHFLMCRPKTVPRAGVVRFPDEPMGDDSLHNWWYRRLEDVGVVAKGTTSGERMHKARHTAGQRVLAQTGNLKAVQKLLGHATIQTTGDIYTDWDIDQLAATMADVLAQEDNQ
jgi:integrase